MKTILLVRHAKSDWSTPSLDDFDRPLNDRGKRDAPVMAHRLIDRKIKIDQFISSPARRAKKTATVFAKEFKYEKEDILFKDSLYGAGIKEFFDVVSGLDKKYDTVAIFSHNPGITEFANQLTTTRIDNIPTCGVYAVKVDADNWEDFREAGKEFWFFDYPKAGNE